LHNQLTIWHPPLPMRQIINLDSFYRVCVIYFNMQHLGVHKDNEIKACLISGMSPIKTAKACRVSPMTVWRRVRQLKNKRTKASPQQLSDIVSPDNTPTHLILNNPRTCKNCGTIARLRSWWNNGNCCPFCHEEIEVN